MYLTTMKIAINAKNSIKKLQKKSPDKNYQGNWVGNLCKYIFQRTFSKQAILKPPLPWYWYDGKAFHG
jgi:hypothetical protein